MQEFELEEEPGKNIADYIAVVKRRRKPIIIFAVVTFLVCLVTAFVLPPTFRSSAVILIEEQDVPPELVRSTITSYAVKRIEEIKQRIMTTSNIMSIVEQFDLYTPKELNRLTRAEIAQNFRKSVAISQISADVVDPRSGRPTQAVIAFSLSFRAENSSTVHKVTNELVTLFLNENLRERTEQSASTSEFLSSEVTALKSQLEEFEQGISQFKEENKGSLPELNRFNLNKIDRGQSEIIEIQTRIQDLETRKINLEARLTQLSPSSPRVLPSGEMVMGHVDRLKALRSEYRKKSAVYKENHPDLTRLKREIDSIVSNYGDTDEKPEISKQLQVVSSQLLQARKQYKESNPIIVSLLREKALLEQKYESYLFDESMLVPDNPSYVLLATQIETTNSEIQALKNKEVALRKKIAEHEALLLMAPAVEKKYLTLLRDYENTHLKYREIKAKQMAAELAQNLERERKGERFTLIQPPEIPQQPDSPDKKLIILFGFVLAAGLGVGSGFAIETIDPRVYGKNSIVNIIHHEPLVVVPYIANDSEKSSKKIKILVFAIGLILMFLLVITLFHFFVKPLDVTWFILLRKFGVS